VRDGHEVRGWPALVDERDSVAVRVLGDPAEARRATWLGLRRLLLLSVPSPLVGVVGRLDNATKLALGANPHGGVPALLDDCLAAAVDALMADAGAPVRDAVGFDRLLAQVRAGLPETLLAVVRQVAAILTVARELESRVSGTTNPALLPAMVDVREQLAGLVHRGFVTETGRDRLADVHRYLTAIGRRLDTLAARPERDRGLMGQVQAVAEEYADWRRGLPEARRDDPAVRAVRWMVEELRVSLFAQTLGTPAPVSEKRIRRAMDEADARLGR
jgi:ATP-dependent helicase HrpA